MEKKCATFLGRISLIFVFINYVKAFPPALIDKSTDKQVLSESDVFISCKFEASSSKDFEIYWLKNGANFTESNKIFSSKISDFMESLTVKDIRYPTTFTCVGKNTDGSVQGDIKVLLADYKPIISQLDDVYLIKGDSHIIQCFADAIPQPTYTWSKQNGMIDGNNVVDKRNGQLYIKSIRDQDEGKYICTASNRIGSTEKPMQLNIAKKTDFILPPKDESVIAGKEFNWVVKYVSLNDNPKIKWYKDSNELTDEMYSQTKVGAVYISTLSFPQVDFTDTGTYQVIVEMKMISGTKRDMTLTVKGKPEVKITGGDALAVNIGETVQLVCTVKAFPLPTVQWLRNGTVLFTSTANDTKDGQTVLTFQIAEVSKDDKSEYECKAKNSLGESEAVISLEVKAGGDGGDGGANKRAIIIIVVLSVIAIIIIAVAVFLYIRYKDRWCGIYDYATGTFYTDLDQYEKDATLTDMENNPHAIKKNINISIRGDRNTSAPVFKFPGSVKRHGSLGFSIKRPHNQSVKSPTSPNESQYAPLDSIVCQGKAVDFKRIIFDEILGEGEYGNVNGGRLMDEEDPSLHRDVSIKMLKDNASSQERCDILKELRMMRRIARHRNVVELVGWCITEDNVYVLEEYMPFGNLLTFLRTNRLLGQNESDLEEIDENDRVDQDTLLSFASQIACGMEHLSQLQIVHRDLASRNIYLGHEKTCKISEYGLVRDIYTENVFRKTTGGQLPVRWMAYESIFQGMYTTESDIWSYGVLLWELCTLGKIPYPGIVRTEQLLDELESGYHMENPGHISTDFYLLMNSCWNRKPDTRPSFVKIMKTIKSLREDGEKHIDVDKLFKEEFQNDITSDDNFSPTDDHHRRNPFAEEVVHQVAA